VANNLGPGKAGSGYRTNAKHIMVVISSNTFNGPDYTAWLATVTGIQDIVLAVGLTPESITGQQAELLAMTKGADPNAVQFIAGPDGLGSLRIWLHQQVCNTGAGTPVSTNFCVPTPSECIPSQLYSDVAILIDESTILTPAYFALLKGFMMTWANQYTIGAGGLQVRFAFVGMNGMEISYGYFGNSNSTAALQSVLNNMYQQSDNARELGDGLSKVINDLTPNDVHSGYRPDANHMIVVFSGGQFTDDASEYMQMATTLKTHYELFLGISLQYADQVPLYSQYQSVVTNGDPNNIYMIAGQGSMDSVLSWLVNRQCSM